MEFDDISMLLRKFKEISSSVTINPTFMEIAGYPHYENVCSNILAFYFRTEAPHELRDLCIKALISHFTTYEEQSNVVVEREVLTSKGNKIDLVIQSDSHLIGIENKIFHWLSNPLEDYSKYLELRRNGKKLVLIIISPYKITDENLYGFMTITYSEFFTKLKHYFGEYISKANTKYLTYLIDFMTTIENLTKGTTMDKQIIDLFAEKSTDVVALMKQVNLFKAELRNKVTELGGMINVQDKAVTVKQGYYRETGELFDCLYHDIKIAPNLPIAIDCYINATGWEITIFVRSGGDMESLKSLLNELKIPYSDGERLEYPTRYTYSEKLETLKMVIQDIIDKITNSSNTR